MENEVINSAKKMIKNWWISLLVGVISIGFGIWCFATPASTFLGLTIVFIVLFLVNGISEIMFAIPNRNIVDGWGWNLFIGIIDLMFAIILLSNLVLAPTIVAYFIGFWLMFQSFWGVGVALTLKKHHVPRWGAFLTVAIIGLVLSAILLSQPQITSFLAAMFIAIIFIIYGLFRISFAFTLKTLHKYL